MESFSIEWGNKTMENSLENAVKRLETTNKILTVAVIILVIVIVLIL